MIVWRDDAQVVEQHAWKVYADDGRARTVVAVRTLATTAVEASAV